MFSTLDGVMQGPGGPGEDVEGGFEQSGWQAPFADAESGGIILESILAMDALFIGRKTYDIWVNHWPQATDQIGNTSTPSRSSSPRGRWSTRTGAARQHSDVPREVSELEGTYGETRLWGSGSS